MLVRPPYQLSDDANQAYLRAAITRGRILELEAAKAAEIENSGEAPEAELVQHCGLVDTGAETSTISIGGQSCELHVLGLTGLLWSVERADLSWSGLELKQKIAANMRIPVAQQRLFLADIELMDEEPLSSVTPPESPLAELLLVRSETDAHWLEMVQVAGMQLAVAPPAVQADRAVVLAAVRQNGQALAHASEELQADHEVVMAAVRQAGLALKEASTNLRADLGVVMEAVSCDGRALEFASRALRANNRVVLTAVVNRWCSFEFAAKDLRNDRHFVRQIVELSGLALEFASAKLQADRDIVLAAVSENGLCLEWASEELRADREIVQVAVERNALALWDASEELRTDPKLLACCRWR
mmetsp:Transcript_17687/g.41087  ORF Transcript_17687/g.41087 Transcript_17687/m.41087 type:complete len:359 (+) Transcript_17687:144-1220(+)